MTDVGWIRPTVILCTYGFFKEMKPSEAFLTPFLEGPDKNMTDKTLSDQIYPISTYSYLVFLFFVLLTTDVMQYKPLIIIESLAYLATRVMLIWGDGVVTMQLMQATYGLASATEIAYYSYIYAMVSEQHYRKVTSYTRLFVLLGKGIGDVLGQILVSTKTSSYLDLNYVSLISVSIAVVISLFLPTVSGSIFTEHTTDTTHNYRPIVPEDSDESSTIQGSQEVVQASTSSNVCAQYFKRLSNNFQTSYKNTKLLKWSIWWALAMCGGLQVEDYAMNLWAKLQHGDSDIYNGAVFAFGTLLSAFCVYLFSIVRIERSILSELMIGAISSVECVLLLLSAYTMNIWVAYVCYVIFRALVAYTLTVASYQIAIEMNNTCGFGLIFGWNTFIAICLQSILTVVVADKKGLDLNVRAQFVIYGWYHAFIACLFLAIPVYLVLKKARRYCCSCAHRNESNQLTTDDVSGNDQRATHNIVI